MSARRHSTAFTVTSAQGTREGAPHWLVNWIRLGALAACNKLAELVPGEQLVLAVSAPVRTMAAAAVAFGFTRQEFVTHTVGDSNIQTVEPGKLNPGDRIWVRTTGRFPRVLVGTFAGVERTGSGEPSIKTSAGRFLLSSIEEIRRLPPWAADVADGQWLFSDAPESSFLRAMLPRHDARSFVTSWSSSLVIVGSRPRLALELEELIGPGTQPPALGHFYEIIRPLDPGQAVGWRSIVMPAHAASPVWEDWPTPPRVILLDGWYAVSRWLDESPAPLVVAVLDRAESGLDSAVAVLQQCRAYATPVPLDGLNWKPPAGCELLAFRSTA